MRNATPAPARQKGAGPVGPSRGDGNRRLNKAFSWIRTVGDYLTGFFLFGLIQGMYDKRQGLDMLVMTSLFGRAIGFPHLFNYYHLRLMPFYVRALGPWKRNVLRERDVFERMNDCGT